MSTPTITTVYIENLFLDQDIQPRQRLDQEKVAEYTALYKAGVELPPIDVYQEEDMLRVSDGFHRTHAAFNAGREEIKARVYQGTKRDAILNGIAANSTHAIPLTAEDKRQAVTRLLQDEEWQQWSDREIARHCGVSHTIVGKQRRQLSGNGVQIRKVRRGTTIYDMQTSTIGKPAADEDAETETAPVVQPAPLVDTPAVLPDGSSVLMHASTPLATGSTSQEAPLTERDRACFGPRNTKEPGGLPWCWQTIDLLKMRWKRKALTDQQFQEVLDELTAQQVWERVPPDKPYGSLDALLEAELDCAGLLTSTAPLATQTETRQAQAETATVETTAGHVTIRQQVREVLPTLKRPYTAPKVVDATGLPIKVARRAMDGLVKTKELVKVPRKPGQYLPR